MIVDQIKWNDRVTGLFDAGIGAHVVIVDQIKWNDRWPYESAMAAMGAKL